ncbi:MAG: class I SAM-dependent methyltransferase [Candidatus Paracaedibacter sp.]
MKIPFYQSSWLGINLLDLAKDIGHDTKQIVGPNFFSAFYQTVLSKTKSGPNKLWLEKKSNLSKWLMNFLTQNSQNKSSILSVGCGFGVVEIPLIQKGLRVDLQECQTHSIQYMQKNHPDIFEKTSFILSVDLSNIPSNSYDVVLSITSTYCLDQQTLLSFLEAVKRILKKGGIFIWYDTVLSIEDIVCYAKSTIRHIVVRDKSQQDLVLWGWKRSLRHQSLRANSKGLELIQTFYFDKDNSVMVPSKFMGLPYGQSLSWQMGIYRS